MLTEIQVSNNMYYLKKQIDPQFSIAKKGYQSSGFNWLRGDSEVFDTIAQLYKIANKAISTKTAMWGDGNSDSTFFGFFWKFITVLLFSWLLYFSLGFELSVVTIMALLLIFQNKNSTFERHSSNFRTFFSNFFRYSKSSAQVLS